MFFFKKNVLLLLMELLEVLFDQKGSSFDCKWTSIKQIKVLLIANGLRLNEVKSLQLNEVLLRFGSPQNTNLDVLGQKDFRKKCSEELLIEFLTCPLVEPQVTMLF